MSYFESYLEGDDIDKSVHLEMEMERYRAELTNYDILCAVRSAEREVLEGNSAIAKLAEESHIKELEQIRCELNSNKTAQAYMTLSSRTPSKRIKDLRLNEVLNLEKMTDAIWEKTKIKEHSCFINPKASSDIELYYSYKKSISKELTIYISRGTKYHRSAYYFTLINQGDILANFCDDDYRDHNDEESKRLRRSYDRMKKLHDTIIRNVIRNAERDEQKFVAKARADGVSYVRECLKRKVIIDPKQDKI